MEMLKRMWRVLCNIFCAHRTTEAVFIDDTLVRNVCLDCGASIPYRPSAYEMEQRARDPRHIQSVDFGWRGLFGNLF